MRTITDKIKEYYKTNLTQKINKSVEDVKGFEVGLDENIAKARRKIDEYSRKNINLNFMDRFTRMLYANPYHLAKIEFAQYIIFLILLYYYNPLSISTKYPVFTKLLVLAVAFGYIILFMFIKMKVEQNEDVDLIEPTESNVIVKIISIIVCFILFMALIKGAVWLLINTSIINVVRHMLGLIIALGVLGIVYVLMKKTINKAKSAPGRKLSTLFLKVVMYLPCLFVDIVEYVKYQLNLTTKPVWILVGIEVALIVLYFIVPYIFDKVMSANGTKLLNQPINLSTEITLKHFINVDNQTLTDVNKLYVDKSFDQMYSDNMNTQSQNVLDLSNNISNGNVYTDPIMPKNYYLAWIYKHVKDMPWLKVNFSVHPQYTDTKNQQFRYSYALSGWFNINPQPPNTNSAYTKYTNILSYGNKVKVEYNGQLGSLRVMGDVASSDTSNNNVSVQIFETKNVLYQRWNNIVINYDEGYIDVFLNGDLVGSLSGVVPYMTFDNVIAGEDNGILGGICNVSYYDKPLSKSNINLTYKSLSSKDVPYVWSLKDDLHFNVKSTGINKQFIGQMKNMVGMGGS